MPPAYLIHRDSNVAECLENWDCPSFAEAAPLEISHFHPRSSDHRPRTQVRALHNGKHLFLRFDVDDRFVVSRATKFQESVCFDSCVEFFFRPKPTSGYFNLEINCGGTPLLHYVEDPTRIESGLKKWAPVSAEHALQITIFHSMPATVFPERAEPTRWRIGCVIPVSMLEPYAGAIGRLDGQRWTANFYKCADRSSHPHWGSWSPIGEALNFHQPQMFGDLDFQ
jgi:Carbohydrate-binding family 9